MLSVFITPWMNPTSIHWATSDAWASTTPSKNARYGLLGLGRLAGGGGRSRGRRGGAAASGRRARGVLERADAQVAGGDARRARRRAASCRGRPPRRCATTASARVVGMPRACIASPITYSRSIGPTAALPSPPRANGVRPEPLRCRSRRPAVHVDAPRRAAAPDRRRGAARSRRTGGRRRPARPASRRRARRCRRARRRPPGVRSAVGIDAELGGQLLVEHEQLRRRRRRRLPRLVQAVEVAHEAVVEREQRPGGDAHRTNANAAALERRRRPGRSAPPARPCAWLRRTVRRNPSPSRRSL